jgi:hypothetical protein
MSQIRAHFGSRTVLLAAVLVVLSFLALAQLSSANPRCLCKRHTQTLYDDPAHTNQVGTCIRGCNQTPPAPGW